MAELFFIVSKVAWSFISPSALFVWLSLLALLLLQLGYLRIAKTLLSVMFVSALAVMAYPVGDVLLEPLEKRFAVPAELPSDIDAIIVLGGGEQLKTSLSWQTAQIGEAGDRYLAAAMLTRHYPQTPLWVSGGSNLLQMLDHQAVADIHRQLLDMAGVPAAQIHIEKNSRNTYVNLQNLQQLLPGGEAEFLLETSVFICRAVSALPASWV